MMLIVNGGLEPLGLRLETLTAERAERARLEALARNEHFTNPVFGKPHGFDSAAAAAMLAEVERYAPRFADFEDPGRNAVRFTFHNPYFGSPDAEVLYAMVRRLSPGSVIEVGSGYSTKLIRQAILDGGLATRLTSIDPAPRDDVDALADEVHRRPVEALGGPEMFASLKADDILFIDSTHAVKPGNDVVFLYLTVLPSLAPGVVIHVHDVYLPWEYPRELIIDRWLGWSEQYLVQALLVFGRFEVLWPGYFLQRTRPDFAARFPSLGGGVAGSFWFRKLA